MKGFSIHEAEPNSGCQVTYFSPNTGSIKASTLASLTAEKLGVKELLNLDLYWIDFLNPSYSELKWIGKVFHIHPLTIEDIQGAESREKYESFRNYYFVSLQTFSPNGYSEDGYTNLDHPISVYNIVMKHCILTFHFAPIRHTEKVLTRYSHLKDYLVLSPDWINYALMDSVVDDFIPIAENLELEADSIDELVFILKESEQADMLRRIGKARKSLSGLLGILKPKAEVVKTVIKRIDALKSEAKSDIKLYLGDVQDHILTMIQSAGHFETILSRAHSNYLAQISIEITQGSNAMNDVLGKLSILATVLVPMSLITGIWGMNVPVPGESSTGLGWFFGIVGFMVFGLIVSICYFVKAKVI
ncbi:Mg2+ transporter protein [Basidiobolus meristosporus CBS 931.73]|uniref:Mg2+ transporter protein n=1 Tax=Basidiobolus meristosporus CBS 931.73 TaxID=1314790 RepID=A0A1Y1YXN6_9FUNG|nr:Mg2+ transporter protein [Basidiobolus meristosporus CBS 931.73]|eukprot:ORY02791.1 Mg2+ transporter protein [Basidiobolus meristosporus CBS 931.73]